MPISDYQCHGQNPKQFDHAGSFHCHFLSDKLNIATYWLPKPELLRIFFYFPLPDTMPKMHNKGCYSPDKPKIEGWYSEILLLVFAHCYLFFSNAVTTLRHQILVWGLILQHDCQAHSFTIKDPPYITETPSFTTAPYFLDLAVQGRAWILWSK